MKFICNGCDKPCILDAGDYPELTTDSLRCVVCINHLCKWEKYDDGKVANLQPKVANLQPKVAKLPKLTAEVFDRPDCPEWAQYAAVNRNNTATWFNDKPIYDGNKRCLWICKATPYYNEVKTIPGAWDASDWENSLIERPKNRVNWDDIAEILRNSKLTFKERKQELPDWCKVGEWVYLCNGTYSRIVSINDCHVNLENGISVGKNSIHEEMVSARLRPYNAEEMKALMGKVIEKGPSMHVVTGFENVLGNECMVHVNGCLYSANDLLRQFTIDNAICGGLEHLENGEWVK